MVKILHPIPKICPSAWNSMAEAATEFANPVIGTRLPAPPNFPILEYRLNPVRRTLSKIRKERAPASGTFLIDTHGLCSVQDELSQKTDESAGEKGFCHIYGKAVSWCNGLDILFVFFLLLELLFICHEKLLSFGLTFMWFMHIMIEAYCQPKK